MAAAEVELGEREERGTREKEKRVEKKRKKSRGLEHLKTKKASLQLLKSDSQEQR